MKMRLIENSNEEVFVQYATDSAEGKGTRMSIGKRGCQGQTSKRDKKKGSGTDSFDGLGMHLKAI